MSVLHCYAKYGTMMWESLISITRALDGALNSNFGHTITYLPPTIPHNTVTKKKLLRRQSYLILSGELSNKFARKIMGQMI